MPKVLQSSLPIARTMSLLQDEIHTQASTLFGPCHSTEKAYRYVQQKNIIIYQTWSKKKNHLSGQILNCREEEKEGLYSLLESVRVRLRNLRKKENKRKKRWKAKKAFRDWKRNPFQAGKDVLDPKCDTNLKCTRFCVGCI